MIITPKKQNGKRRLLSKKMAMKGKRKSNTKQKKRRTMKIRTKKKKKTMKGGVEEPTHENIPAEAEGEGEAGETTGKPTQTDVARTGAEGSSSKCNVNIECLCFTSEVAEQVKKTFKAEVVTTNPTTEDRGPLPQIPGNPQGPTPTTSGDNPPENI